MTTSTPSGRLAALTFAAISFIALLTSATAYGAPARPELQKLVRAATFEVVVRKPEQERLTYEKPLPLDLLPFTERNDKYWSIGTAFAIGPNQFLSAGHVVVAGVGSRFGAPALRDSSGKVYQIASITRFSMHEDFATFTLEKPPVVTPLDSNTQPEIDDAVYAVGNALGDGVVIRDGLLTSMTPEDQDGRWKWLRFSAAASPGNSGGPLLDQTGRVVGLVVARSLAENLNFALPIERVLQAEDGKARIDTRNSFVFPVLTDPNVSRYTDSFDLPLSYPQFEKRLLSSMLDQYQRELAQVLTSRVDELFPRGQSAKLLSQTATNARPTLVAQTSDRVWEAEDGESSEGADLPDGGRVTVAYANGLGLFTLKRSDGALDPSFYDDSRAFMDAMVKVLKPTRPVGSQSIRITSFGAAAHESAFTDQFGRKWRWLSWPLDFTDIDIHVFALPVPQGFVGFLRYAPSVEHAHIGAESAAVANFIQAPYRGTIAQWQAFLKNPALYPPVLGSIRLDFDAEKALAYTSPRLQMNVPHTLLKLTSQGVLQLDMVFMMNGEKLILDAGRVTVGVDDEMKTYVTAGRQVKPAPEAGKDALSRWDEMQNKKGAFAGNLGYNKDLSRFWLRHPASAGATAGPIDRTAGVLYDLGYETDQRLLPRELESIRAELFKAVRIQER